MSKNEQWMESSLTSPSDRLSTREKPWRPASNALPLTDSETDKAIEALNKTSYISLDFPRRDKTFVDPAIINQVYSLFSFVPSKEAKPDKNGVYGYGKIRGCFATDIEANQRAEYIIRNIDSYHPIYHGFVGRPFPITSSSDYSAEVNEIDIKKQMTDSISSDVKSKKLEEKKEIEEMQNREKALLDESKSIQDGTYVENLFDNYITLRVKKAQLTWTYVEHKNKMKEIEGILARTRKELEDLDSSDSTYKEKYFDKYKQARNISGINDKPIDTQDNFIKYMVEDLAIPEVDKLYDQLYPKEVAQQESKDGKDLEELVNNVIQDVEVLVKDVEKRDLKDVIKDVEVLVKDVKELVEDEKDVIKDVEKLVEDGKNVVTDVEDKDVVKVVEDVVKVVGDVEKLVKDIHIIGNNNFKVDIV